MLKPDISFIFLPTAIFLNTSSWASEADRFFLTIDKLYHLSSPPQTPSYGVCGTSSSCSGSGSGVFSGVTSGLGVGVGVGSGLGSGVSKLFKTEL